MEADDTSVYPGESDIAMLQGYFDQRVSREELTNFVEMSLRERLINLFCEILASAQQVYDEAVLEGNEIRIDSSTPPYPRVVMMPGKQWVTEARLRERTLFSYSRSPAHRERELPNLSLTLNPPSSKKIHGARPPHYTLALGLHSNDSCDLGAEAWYRNSGLFLRLCTLSDLTMTQGETPLKDVEEARGIEDKLQAFFSCIRVRSNSPRGEMFGPYYFLELEFAWPFGAGIEAASLAVLFIYPLYAATIAHGVGQRDKLIDYWSKLSARFPSSPPQVTNYKFTDPILRRTHT